MAFSEKFEQLFNRKPTEEELAEFLRIQQVLGIRDNDAIWAVILALQYYGSLYKLIPEQVESHMSMVSKNVESLAEAQTAKAQADLSTAVIDQAQKLAAKIDYLKIGWITLAVLGCLLLFGSFCFFSGMYVAANRGDLTGIFAVPAGYMLCGIILLLGMGSFWQGALKFSQGTVADAVKYFLGGFAAIIVAAGVVAIS